MNEGSFKTLRISLGALTFCGLSFVAASAQAETQGERPLTIGLGLRALEPFHVSGGTPSFIARSQGVAFGLQPYGEWRLSPIFAIGLAVPVTMNAPGATSNAYDVGLTPRLRVGYGALNWLYPFALVEAGPAWSHQHPGAWIFGGHASLQAGARFAMTNSTSISAALGYDFTSFSGDFPLYYATSGPPAPVEHGSVTTNYIGADIGIELAF
jgi:hypothetical protein